MSAHSRNGILLAGVSACAVLVAIQCGGGTPDAKDPTTQGSASAEEGAPKWEGDPPASSGKKPIKVEDPTHTKNDIYDKEHTEIVLNRATRLVNDNCGLTKDSDGKATGPWGPVTLTLTLGHNGHMKGVKVPSPYDGKPVGTCIVKAFENLVFPPWAGADADVEWTVELHPPPK